MTEFIFSAPAKINLYLHVTGKREDGYHLLDSLVVFAPDCADKIIITPWEQFSFSVSGPFAHEFSEDDLREDEASKNLIVKAAYNYKRQTGVDLKVDIHLEKNIPMGAGIGGGSADAAATIKALEQFYAAPLPNRERVLLSLGADVPVCYHAKPCRFEGIGENISDVPELPPLSMLIVWPDEKSPTKGVFKAYHGRHSKPVAIPSQFSKLYDFIGFLKTTRNDLDEASKSLYPVIDEAENMVAAQKGCLLARMSGSGTSVFGLFETEQDCLAARDALQAAYKNWWVRTAKAT